MQKYYKSKLVLYTNIVISVILLTSSILCFTRVNETVLHLGIDLYLIFGFVFIVFAAPFIGSLIRYLLMPKVILTIYKDEFIIHRRKKDIRIHSRKLVGTSKLHSFNLIYGVDIGTLKILLKDNERPIYIRFIDDLDKAYQTLNVLILRYFEYFNKNN